MLLKLSCLSFAASIALTFPAMAVDKPESCAAIDDGGERLVCYDSIFRTKTTVDTPPTGTPTKWQVTTAQSKIDDSKGVFLYIESDDDIPGKYGGQRAKASMVIRCMEGTTAMTLQFADHFMADNNGYGDVTFRVDDKKAITKGLDESTDNSALGLFNGGSSIPFIRSLFGANRLIVRATPFNESALTVTYSIAGLEETIKPLRETCKW